MGCSSFEYAASVTNGATNATDGCTACSVGQWSAGGGALTCGNTMNCPAGQKSVSTPSSSTDCEDCSIGE